MPGPPEGRENQLKEHGQRNRKPVGNHVPVGSPALESLRWLTEALAFGLRFSTAVWRETRKRRVARSPHRRVWTQSGLTFCLLSASPLHFRQPSAPWAPPPPWVAVSRGAPFRSRQGRTRAGFQAWSSPGPSSGVRLRSPLRAQCPRLPGHSGRVCWVGGTERGAGKADSGAQVCRGMVQMLHALGRLPRPLQAADGFPTGCLLAT